MAIGGADQLEAEQNYWISAYASLRVPSGHSVSGFRRNDGDRARMDQLLALSRGELKYQMQSSSGYADDATRG
jgi:hypothetical protein